MPDTPEPIHIEWDGRFTVTYRVGDQESAFRVLPEVGRLIAAAPRMLELLHKAFYKSGMGCPACLAEPCRPRCMGPDARALLKEIDG